MRRLTAFLLLLLLLLSLLLVLLSPGSFTEEEVALLDAVAARDTDDIPGNTRRWFAEVKPLTIHKKAKQSH